MGAKVGSAAAAFFRMYWVLEQRKIYTHLQPTERRKLCCVSCNKIFSMPKAQAKTKLQVKKIFIVAPTALLLIVFSGKRAERGGQRTWAALQNAINQLGLRYFKLMPAARRIASIIKLAVQRDAAAGGWAKVRPSFTAA